ncbi:hypothetical protein SAMD00023353_3201070 [Rosellinia necatrix]|uniref:Uncharacterized protein n=1 Tax=Rosellinia necatrix TaxID=77044 RepID=A0A1W2TIP5_ROSNE|nr:hypothetical protein SAMD00023353_3201070 [Rosellinia necatrix]
MFSAGKPVTSMNYNWPPSVPSNTVSVAAMPQYEWEDNSLKVALALWRAAIVQVDSPLNVIRLHIIDVDCLGDCGQRFFVNAFSRILDKDVEFVLDNANHNRVYLGHSADLQKALDSVLVRHPTDRFATLYHRQPQQPGPNTRETAAALPWHVGSAPQILRGNRMTTTRRV